jgi:hypothetical protein
MYIGGIKRAQKVSVSQRVPLRLADIHAVNLSDFWNYVREKRDPSNSIQVGLRLKNERSSL